MTDGGVLSTGRKTFKEDLGLHAYTIRNSSHSFHARVHGDLSVFIRLAFPYECGSTQGGRQQQIETLLIRETRNLSSGQLWLVKDSNLLRTPFRSSLSSL